MPNFRSLRHYIASVFCLLVMGCTGLETNNEVTALKEIRAVGSPFTQFLADEYRIFVTHEFGVMYDHPDSLHFARKGIAAAQGETVLPEPLADWNLLPEHIREMTIARARLMSALDIGARNIAPREAAIAQVHFDCWVEQQEENWQTEDIVACRNTYLEAIDRLEHMIKPPEPPMAPVVASSFDTSKQMRKQDAVYLVFFDFDSSTLEIGGQNVLDNVAKEITKRANLESVVLTGHTDRAGSENYNTTLAVQRAIASKQYLMKLGVSETLLKVQGKGETDPLVVTEDNIREPANRRVEITFK